MTAWIAVIFGVSILIREFFRQRRLLYVDFLRGVSFVFVVIYSIVPFMLYVIGPNPSPRFFWIYTIDYQDPYLSIPALLMAIIGYICIVLGYSFSSKGTRKRSLLRFISTSLERINHRTWLTIAIVLGSLSLISLLLYSVRRSASIYILLMYAGDLRVGRYIPGVKESSFTFLTWAMPVIAATFILLGLLLDNKVELRKRKYSRVSSLLLLLLALFGVALSSIVLWMRAGRLHLLNFFLVIFIVLLTHTKSRLLHFFSYISTIAVISTIFLFGKYLFGATKYIEFSSTTQEFLQLLAAELSFPFLSLVNTIAHIEHYRYFVDFILAPLYVLGPPLWKIFADSTLELPLSVAKENTSLILGTTEWGEIPVDIITLGYFNAGIIGVVLTGLLFGILIGLMERLFSSHTQGVLGVLRIGWIVLISTVGIIYADPVNVLRDGLYLILPTALVVVTSLAIRRSKPLKYNVSYENPSHPS